MSYPQNAGQSPANPARQNIANEFHNTLRGMCEQVRMVRGMVRDVANAISGDVPEKLSDHSNSARPIPQTVEQQLNELASELNDMEYQAGRFYRNN